VCGANQPIHEVCLGDTENIQAADAEFEVLPEIVASLGMARAFYDLMASPTARSVEQIFGDVAETVASGVDAVLDRVGDARSGLMAAAVEIGLERTTS